jgi:hypothetical protein
MPITTPATHLRGAAWIGSIALLLLALGAWHWASGPSVEKDGALYTVRAEGYEYSFDAAWRQEALRPTPPSSGIPRDLASSRPEVVARLRGLLLRRLGVSALEEIPRENEAEVRALRSLGYL